MDAAPPPEPKQADEHESKGTEPLSSVQFPLGIKDSADPLGRPAPSPVRPIRNKWRLLFLICVLAVVADQATKWWAHGSLQHQRRGRITVVKNFFSFTYVRNPGAAWGFLADSDESFRKPFFLTVSVIAIFFIFYLVIRLQSGQQLTLIALSLVLGGAVGNLIDRLRLGYVIDFLDFHVGRSFRWPTFNVADIAISAGVGLLLLEAIVQRRARERRSLPDTSIEL